MIIEITFVPNNVTNRECFSNVVRHVMGSNNHILIKR